MLWQIILWQIYKIQKERGNMLFELKRPKPALPNSYFWTWDHSTNWILDNPGVVNFGCYKHS